MKRRNFLTQAALGTTAAALATPALAGSHSATKTMTIVSTWGRDSPGVTSRTVVWLFLKQFRFECVPVFHSLQGRLAA